MSTPILIDLRKLTQAHFDEAAPHAGACLYSAPCIIGTLLTPEQRAQLDAYVSPGSEGGASSGAIDLLVTEGLIQFPDPLQQRAAFEMQSRFDCDLLDDVQDMVTSWSKRT